MDYVKSLDVENSTVVIETFGNLSLEIFPVIVEDIIGTLKANQDYFKVLANHENSKVTSLAYDEIVAIAGECEKMNAVLRGGKFAVVLAIGLAYSVGQMWKTFTEEKLSFEAQVFQASNEAIAWLQSS